MGKFIVATSAMFVVAIILTGCTSVKTTDKFNGMELTAVPKAKTVTHINADIYGVYLFNFVPLFCGSSAASGKTSVFKDTVTLDNAMLHMTAAARNAGCNRVTDVTSNIDSTWLPLTFILWRKNAQVSGNGIK